MIPYLLLGSAVAVAGAFWYGTSVGEAQCQAQQKSVETVAREVKDAAQAGAAEAIAKLKPRNVTITNEVQREIQTHTVYSDCRNTAVGLRGINEALTGQRAEPTGDQQLPRAGATR